MWLERIDRKAAGLRQRQAEEERGRARRPLAPDWVLELNRATGHPLAVHAGDCGMAGRRKQPIGPGDARRLLTTDGVPACPICRPDTSLHIVDGLASPATALHSVGTRNGGGAAGRGHHLRAQVRAGRRPCRAAGETVG
ncbi:DUF6233 domain-containing protein [Streptomyces sp. NPDC001601]|uniref:DUF6233 domain-containing protein n=1 Tax=Streptomyces sp. NPDC001601 TaxID=3364592 RepID=UPI0036BEEB87